jgi:hypothetical protein
MDSYELRKRAAIWLKMLEEAKKPVNPKLGNNEVIVKFLKYITPQELLDILAHIGELFQNSFTMILSIFILKIF